MSTVGRPVVLLSALIMSAPGEYRLATLAGWDDRTALLMPVCLSVYAATAATIAASRPKGTAGRVSALVGAGVALFLALAAQVTAHLIESGHMTSSGFPVAATSVVPPLVVGHMLHLAAHSRPVTGAEAVTDADSPVTAATVTVTPPAAPVMVAEAPDSEAVRLTAVPDAEAVTRPASRPTVAEIRSAIEEIRSAGQDPSGATLAERLGCSPRTARRHLARLAEASGAVA